MLPHRQSRRTRPPDRPIVNSASEHVGVARRFALLGSGEALARCTAFVTMAVLAHRVDAGSFGIIAFAMAVVLYLGRVADAGIDLGVGVREVAAARGALGALVPAVLALRLVLAVGLVATFGLAAMLWNATDGRIIALYTLTLLPLAAGTRWVLTGLERTAAVGAARTLGELVTLCGVALFVHDANHLWRVPLAQLTGDSLATLLLAHRVRTLGIPVRPKWDGAVVARLKRHITPYVGSTLLGLVIFNSDLIFLRFLRDREAVGYYAAAYALISFLISISSAHLLTLLPALARLNGASDAQRQLYRDAVARMLAVVLPVAVGGALVADPLVRLAFGESFASAIPVLVLLLATVPLFAMRDIASCAILARGREGMVFRISALSAVLSVALNLLLIPPFGMFGAASATLLTEAVRLVLCVTAAHRLGFPWPPLIRGWRPMVAVLVMWAAVQVMPVPSLWTTIPFAALIYAASLFAVKGIRRGSGWLPSLNV